MKAINWAAARSATPPSVTCNHCGRPDIVVNRTNGLLAPHYREPRQSSSRKAKRQREKCAGGGQLYTSTPGGGSG